MLRQTIRTLLRAPTFALATVVTLAVAIGATTAIFAVVDGVLLNPLPFPQSDRLIAVRHLAPTVDDDEHDGSPAFYFFSDFCAKYFDDLWKEIEKWAADELRSVNGQIEYVLRQAVGRRKADRPKDEWEAVMFRSLGVVGSHGRAVPNCNEVMP